MRISWTASVGSSRDGTLGTLGTLRTMAEHSAPFSSGCDWMESAAVARMHSRIRTFSQRQLFPHGGEGMHLMPLLTLESHLHYLFPRIELSR